MPNSHGYDFRKHPEQFAELLRQRKAKCDDPRGAAIEAAAVFTPEVAKQKGVRGVIRQSSREPNKTERRFEQDWLMGWRAEGAILRYSYESVTLKIANGCRYTPDWRTVDSLNRVTFYEIKARGMIYDDAIVKLKVAASVYPEYAFYLCAYDHKTGWSVERVLA